MTVYKCDLCLQEISHAEDNIYIGRKILRWVTLCTECGKPALDFLESVELKLEKKSSL